MSTIKRGSVVEVLGTGGRVALVKRLDPKKKSRGRWWKVRFITDPKTTWELPSYPEKSLQFIYQEGGY